MFDTAFHQSMPEKAFLYAIPRRFYEKYAIRRYGFHGTNHEYVAMRLSELTGRDTGKLKIVSCHLGNGASVAAIKNGRCVDTSMGFTPLEGLVMGTRCGDIDASVVTFLMKKENLSPEEMERMLNRESGLLALSGFSNDMRNIEKKAEKGDERAKLAIDAFSYRVAKYIGAYAAAMNGIDYIVFTGGIGEKSAHVRKCIISYLTFLEAFIDEKKNESIKEGCITADPSQVLVYVILADEERLIAQKTKELTL